MKYLKRFSQHADYEAYMGGGEVFLPNVSVCDDDAADVVHYNPIVEPTIPNNEIWYKSVDGNSISYKSTLEYLLSTPYSTIYVGDTVLDEYEEDGWWKIKFENDVTEIVCDQNNKQITHIFLVYDFLTIGTNLQEVLLPNTLTTIGEYAFYKCSSLTSVTIPNSVTSIGYACFYNCSGLTSVNIPNSVTSIGGGAFDGCSGLTSVTIPNSVTSIGDSAFEACNGLTSVTIPNSVTSIGYKSFLGCSGLTSITIPNSVTIIGTMTFYDCTNLTTMTIEATTPPTLRSTDTISTAATTIYVPSESVDAYKTASNWSEFADIIQPIS